MQKSHRSKTIELYAALLLMVFMACSPSGDARRSASEPETAEQQPISDNNFEDPTTHNPQSPGRDQAVTRSQVFVDAAWLTGHKSRRFVHITGHLPTPCHRLDMPEVRASEETMTIELRSWQTEGVICMQVLQPFVYLHEITGLNLPQEVRIFVNGTPLSRAP